MEQSWQLINRAWILNDYHSNKIIEWIREVNNVPEWWIGLLQRKQMLAIKHKILVYIIK